MLDKTQIECNIQYVLDQQYKSLMKAPTLPDWWKHNKYENLKYKFYEKHKDKIHEEYIGIRFYHVFDRWVKHHYKFSLEQSKFKNRLDDLF